MPMTEYDLYKEILDFLCSCGGKYTRLTERACLSIADAVYSGQYLIQRDEEEKIKQFVSYWKINEDDLPLAYEYIQPADIYSGDIIFTVDYANKGGIRDIYKFFGEMMPLHEPNAKAICHEHKGRLIRWNREQEGKAWSLDRR